MAGQAARSGRLLATRHWLIMLMLALVGDGESTGGEELYHQLGEPSVVTVVTATTGKAELARCIESVRAQLYHGAIQHIVVVDGDRFAPAVRALVGNLEPPASPSPPYASCPEAPHVKNSPCGAAEPPLEGGGPGPRWLDVVYLPFNMHGDGGRVYAAGPNMARGAYVSNLDEDNYIASDHIGSLVKLLIDNELDWGYSLRTIAMLGQPLVHDRCESLGFLHDVWDWDGVTKFSAAHSKNHVDTNCYMARRPVALALANEWNCLPRHNDRCYLQAAADAYPAFGTTRSHTVFYDVDPATEKGLSILGFFSEGLKAMNERYRDTGGTMPWESPANGGNGAPPSLPLHPACAGFTGDSVPFFCQPSLTQGDKVELEEACDEGWSGPDCLDCAPGYSGDFCNRVVEPAPATVASAASGKSDAGELPVSAAVAGTETNERHIKKKSKRKAKSRQRIYNGTDTSIVLQQKVHQAEIDALEQKVRDSAADRDELLAALHNLAVSRATFVLSQSDSQQAGDNAESAGVTGRDWNEAVHALHRLIDASPTDSAGLSLLSALLLHGADHARSSSEARQLQSIREAVRVMRHARRHNPNNRAIAQVYSDIIEELDTRVWESSLSVADKGGTNSMTSLCSYSVPWQADTRLPQSPAATGDAVDEIARDENWKPLIYVFDGGNMLGTWLELSSNIATAPCARSATWVSDLACLSAADAVVFDCPDGTVEQHATTKLLAENSGGKPRHQLWVLLCGESAGRMPLLTDAAFMGRFDIKVTHQPDADITYSYLPQQFEIFAEHLPQAKTHFSNWIASNCVEHRQRKVQDLMAALCPLTGAVESDDSGGDNCRKVDCLGPCLRNTPWPADGTLQQLHGSTKMALLARYKFTLAFENSQSEGYVTEKFFQPLIAGSVPVYWGAPDVADFAPDPRSYINVEDFESVHELAEYLAYLDRNDTAYAELLAWKHKPLRHEFVKRASEGDTIGNVYGEGVQHRSPMGGWNPCRLNNLIRQRLQMAAAEAGISTTDSASDAVLHAPTVTSAVSRLDGRVVHDAWWMPVSAPGEETHMFRLTANTVPAEVVREYCARHPCGAANQVALQGAIEAQQVRAAERATIEQLLELDSSANDSSWTAAQHQQKHYCVLGSRNEGFFSNVLQAIDGLMACSANGLPATVQWTEEDFPYRGDTEIDGPDMKLNAWDQFFLPVGVMPDNGYKGKLHVIRDYSRMPRQVPTQFEKFANSRGDNLHCPGLKDPIDRLRVNHAMHRLGIATQPWVQETVHEFVRSNFNDAATGLRAGLVLGVHHRGTDHWDELPGGSLVPFELYLQTVRQIIARWRDSSGQGGGNNEKRLPVVFVASDSREAVAKLRGELDASAGGSGEARVVSAADVVRRDHIHDNIAIHRVRGDGRRKGANVLVDSLLLAECDEMIHAQSNVALFAAYTNPKLRLHYLGHEQVFAFHEAQAGRPLRFKFNFHSYGGEIEARSQMIWSQARSLGLTGEVAVVDTGAVRAVDVDSLERGPGEAVGHVIGHRSAIESFRFRLFTLETLGDSGAASDTPPVPSWTEVTPVVEQTVEDVAVNQDTIDASTTVTMVLHGSYADINHCPVSSARTGEADSTDDEEIIDSRLLPPAQAADVRVVALTIETSAEGTTQPPQVALLRNVLHPRSCDATVRIGCDSQSGQQIISLANSLISESFRAGSTPSRAWVDLQDALHARISAALEPIIGSPGSGQRLMFEGSVKHYSLLEASPSSFGVGGGGDGVVLLGKVVLQLSRSHHQGPIVFPYLERIASEIDGGTHDDHLELRVNPRKSSCDSTCGEAAAAAANAAGVPYCCCGDLLRVWVQQGEALWLGRSLRDIDSKPSPYGYARRCPLAAPTVGLEVGDGAALPTGGWAYIATVSLIPS